MATLKETLENQLVEFKATYLNYTKEWAITSNEISLKAQAKRKELFQEAKKATYLKGKEINLEIQSLTNIINRSASIHHKNTLEDILASAEKHFESSLNKLVERLTRKGFTGDNIKVKSCLLKNNLEITITDGNKTVRAFTIIASGEIQRPHYRYLIK